MQADGEEQQDDADLGQLVGQRLIGDEARREGTDQDAGEQIADQRRDAQPVRRQTEAERQDEPRGDRRDEWRFVFSFLVAACRDSSSTFIDISKSSGWGED
jgi:hypothetical protein